MVRNLQILPEIPVLPEGSGIRHVATSYEVSYSPYFETTDNNVRDEEAIIVSNIEDTVNIRSYYLDIEKLTENTDVYARYKLHFEIPTANGVRNADTGWSSIVNMKGDQEGFKVSDVILATPILTAEKLISNVSRRLLKITSTPMKVYIGYGDHKSTSWRIKDSDGVVLFERKNSTELLTEIEIPYELLEFDKIYIIECQHHSSNNADSHWGKQIYNDGLTYTELFDVNAGEELVVGKILPADVILHMNKFVSIDLVLKNNKGEIVAQALNNTSLNIDMYIPDIPVGKVYTLWARLEYLQDEYTEWKYIRSYVSKARSTVDINPNIKYDKDYKFIQNLIQPGIKYLYSTELVTGGFIIPNSSESAFHGLGLYNLEAGRLSYVNDVKGSENSHYSKDLSGWSSNVIPLLNGNVIINRMEINNDVDLEGLGDSVFLKYSISRVNREMTLLDVLRTPEELGSTGVSGSAVTTADNTVWYIPNKQGKSNKYKNLSLYKIDTDTMVSEKVADLPFKAKTYVSMCVLNNIEFLVAGGMKEIPTGDPSNWKRDNDLIYKYNTVTKTFTVVADFSEVGKKEWYNLHMVLRADGNVAIFNNSEAAGVAEDQTILLYNTYDGVVRNLDNDFSDGRRYLKTLVSQDRDIYRISSSPIEPQLMYTHQRQGFDQISYGSGETIEHTITQLVVPENKEVFIDNPYKYTKITIEGSVKDNTSGKLIWLGRNVRREFQSDTLFVTKSMMLYDDNVDELTKDKKWKNIVMLDGTEMTISDANQDN